MLLQNIIHQKLKTLPSHFLFLETVILIYPKVQSVLQHFHLIRIIHFDNRFDLAITCQHHNEFQIFLFWLRGKGTYFF